MLGNPIEILLVEDNPADIELTRQGLLKAKIANNLYAVEHGGQAISFLRNEGPYVDAPRPDLILLDLNLPHVSGRDVLKTVKSDPQLQDIPIVMLSSIDEPDEIKAAYAARVNAYMTKPPDFSQFVDLVQSLGDYWFTMVQLPTGE